MTKVADSGYEATGRVTFICDFSPPRAGEPSLLSEPPAAADFLLVNRNPGRAVRADSAMLAAHHSRTTGQQVIFALLTRDMNRLALQSYLLGAQLLGLENLVVAQGDPIPHNEPTPLQPVADYLPTELIAAISQLNQGYRLSGTPVGRTHQLLCWRHHRPGTGTPAPSPVGREENQRRRCLPGKPARL